MERARCIAEMEVVSRCESTCEMRLEDVGGSDSRARGAGW